MSQIRRNVRDLDSDERRKYEDALGHKLTEDQQIIIQVVKAGTSLPLFDYTSDGKSAGALPAWCKVYDGLTDEEIAEVECVALERNGR